MIEVKLVRAGQLTSNQLAHWSEIQLANSILNSPFFRPEFTQVVSKARRDVEVAVLRRNGREIGFFPFQRGRRNLAQPVVGRLSDMHGVIVEEDVAWSGEELLRGCRLKAWYFDHLVASQQPLQPFHWCEAESPYMDLSFGFAKYKNTCQQQGSRLIPQLERKARKLKREQGPLRLEFHTTAREALRALCEWKAAQYRRTGRLQVFRYNWVMKLLKRIRYVKTPEFSGVCSALYVRDKVIAVHLGMRSRHVLHWWFPSFDRDYNRYSPGLILLLELAKAAESLEIHRIDLGKGPERYKASLKSGSIALGVGCIDRRPLQRTAWHSWHAAKQWMRSSNYRKQFEIPIDASRRLRQWLAFR